MTCDESVRVQAWFDGEVDALSAVDIERHVAGCAECDALHRQLAALRTAMRQQWPPSAAPPALHSRIRRRLDEAAGFDYAPADLPVAARRQRLWFARPFWAGALAGAGATAGAVLLAFLLRSPSVARTLPDELVADHVRSLLPSHLIDVASTDRHTVKPWFAGHADVSPVVADFEAQGYRLVGGRADLLQEQRSAVVVYQHALHVISVFSWASRGAALPGDTTRRGYRLVFWRSGDLAYCAISDTGWEELRGLMQLLADRDRRDAPE